MEGILADYLKMIESEDMDEVYAARMEQIDGFENLATENYIREVAKLDPVTDRAKIEALYNEYNEDLERFTKIR